VKIALIITELQLGGAQRIVIELAGRLAQSDWEVCVITNERGLLLKDLQGIRGVEVITVATLRREITPLKDLLALVRIISLLNNFKPDIVHTHTPKAGLIGRVAARLLRIPCIHTVHGIGCDVSAMSLVEKVYLACERLAAKLSTVQVVVSERLRKTCVEHGLAPDGKVRVISGGFDARQFAKLPTRSQARAALGLPVEGVVIGTVSCMKPGKRVGDFVEVCKQVRSAIPNMTAVVVGDGELRQEIQRQIGHGGLEESIRLLGWRRDVPAIMAALDVFVLMSAHEGLGLVVLEAMAAGVPVVATRVDGCIEIIEKTRAGVLIGRGDIEGGTAAVVRLLADRGRLEQMGRRGRKEVARWNFDAMCERYKEVYWEVCNADR
jgi:glycosyltransferase involved in cell wall biosynthesis